MRRAGRRRSCRGSSDTFLWPAFRRQLRQPAQGRARTNKEVDVMAHRFAIAILTAISVLPTSPSGAAELKVLGAGPIERPFKALLPGFTKETGHTADGVFDTVGILAQADQGGREARHHHPVARGHGRTGEGRLARRRHARRGRPRRLRARRPRRRAGARHLDARCAEEDAAGGPHGRLCRSRRPARATASSSPA